MSRTVITVLFSLDGFHLPPWNGVVAGWACHRCRMASFVSKGKKRIFTQPVKPHGRPKPVYFDDFETLMDKGRLFRKPASTLEGRNGPLASPGRRGRRGVAAAACCSKARPLHPGSRCHRNSPHTSPTSRCHRQIRMPPPSPGFTLANSPPRELGCVGRARAWARRHAAALSAFFVPRCFPLVECCAAALLAKLQ